MVSTYLVSRILFSTPLLGFFHVSFSIHKASPWEECLTILPMLVFCSRFRLIHHFEWYWTELVSARHLCIMAIPPTNNAQSLQYYMHKFRILFQISETSVSFIHCCSKSKLNVFLFWRYPETKNREHQFTSLLLVKIQFGQRHKTPWHNRVTFHAKKVHLLWTCLSANHKVVK